MRHRDFKQPEFQEYTRALGEMVLAWNDLHLELSGLFGTIIGIHNKIIPSAMWNAVNSDRSQRELISAVTNLNENTLGLNIPDHVRKETRFILKRATALEDFRNDALHAPIVSGQDGEIIPFSGMGNKRARKLSSKNDTLKDIHIFYEEVIILRDYVFHITDAMRHTRPWPDRPKMPNRERPKNK